MTEITPIPLDSITAGDNDRKVFEPTALAELAASIQESGLAQPITVRPLPTGVYEIVAGERRFRAHQLIGAPTIDAVIRDLDDEAAADLMLVENLSRVDLDPMEEAESYGKRIDQGVTVEELAVKAGVSPARIRFRLDLLNLREEARHLVSIGDLGLETARAISQLDRNRQAMVLHTMAVEDLTAGDIWSITRKLLADQQSEGLFDPDNVMQIEVYVEEAKSQRSIGKAGLAKLAKRLLNVVEGEFDGVDDPRMQALISEAHRALD